MLSSIHRFCLTSFLCTWLLYCFCKAAVNFTGNSRWYGRCDGDFNRPLVCAVIFLALIGLRLVVDRKRTATLKTPARLSAWTYLIRQFPSLSIVRIGYLASTSAIFAFFTLTIAGWCCDPALKSVAALIDSQGNHTSAERIFSLASSRGKGRSLATWQTVFHREDPETERSRNDAVRLVYGEQSRELAGRFYYVGMMHDMSNYESKTESDYDAGQREALIWYEKSLALSRENHFLSKSLDALTQLIVIRTDLSGKNAPDEKTTRYISEASKLWGQADEPVEVTTPNLPTYVDKFCSPSQRKLFQQKLGGANYSDSKLRNEPPALWAELLVFAIGLASSGIGVLAYSEITLTSFHNVLENNLKATYSIDDARQILNDLIAINLCRGNLVLADLQSRMLLCLADENSSFEFEQLKPFEQRDRDIANIFKFEFFCLLHAAVIVWSFY